MMGLEPTTFCMARTRGRSRSIARVRRTGLPGGTPRRQANVTEPERTASAAIAAIVGGL
jgi:hypothetical protein